VLCTGNKIVSFKIFILPPGIAAPLTPHQQQPGPKPHTPFRQSGKIKAILRASKCTRWFKYDRDKLWLVYTQIVPVIFQPPCTYSSHRMWFQCKYYSLQQLNFKHRIMLKCRNYVTDTARERENKKTENSYCSKKKMLLKYWHIALTAMVTVHFSISTVGSCIFGHSLLGLSNETLNNFWNWSNKQCTKKSTCAMNSQLDLTGCN
jgi:hypothetical protein